MKKKIFRRRKAFQEAKGRFTFWITQKNKKRLEEVADLRNFTMGQILNALIEQKLVDELIVLTDQIKDHYSKIAVLEEKIKMIKEKRGKK